MILSLHTVFIIAAAVVFLIAAFALLAPSRVNLIALGLLLLVLSMLSGCIYNGPSVAVNGTYNGIGVGVALYGQNPVAHATPTPAPTPLPPLVPYAK